MFTKHSGGLRLLTVHAHPDDESSKGAATLARYAAEGVEVLVATCTGGERGSVLNPALDRPEVRADLTRIRREEMEAAREILGVRQQFLGFVDSGMPGPEEPLPEGCFAAQPLEVAAAPLVALIREFRPHVVITYDETGGYPHPDHVMTHKVAVEAFEAAADPKRHPEAGEPWQAAKLYYHLALSRVWFQTLHDAMTERGVASEMGELLAGWPDTPPALAIPPGSSAPSSSPYATRRCWRTPPRSSPEWRSWPTRGTLSARSGRPRTTTWRGASCPGPATRSRQPVQSVRSRTICSRG